MAVSDLGLQMGFFEVMDEGSELFDGLGEFCKKSAMQITQE